LKECKSSLCDELEVTASCARRGQEVIRSQQSTKEIKEQGYERNGDRNEVSGSHLQMSIDKVQKQGQASSEVME
jgi:hypothetical protein